MLYRNKTVFGMLSSGAMLVFSSLHLCNTYKKINVGNFYLNKVNERSLDTDNKIFNFLAKDYVDPENELLGVFSHEDLHVE